VDEEFQFLNEEDFINLDLKKEIDLLYLVKWQNLSYIDSNWEKESLLANPEKIQEFKMFNRALDKVI
jgi:hypothetical protein